MLYLNGLVKTPLKRPLFDFSSDMTHLGDRLFFLPLVSGLRDAGYEMCLNPHDRITTELFNAIVADPLRFNYVATDATYVGDPIIVN